MKCLSCLGLLPWPHTEILLTHRESIGTLLQLERVCAFSVLVRDTWAHISEREEEIQRHLNSQRQTVPQSQKGQDHKSARFQKPLSPHPSRFLTSHSTFRSGGWGNSPCQDESRTISGIGMVERVGQVGTVAPVSPQGPLLRVLSCSLWWEKHVSVWTSHFLLLQGKLEIQIFLWKSMFLTCYRLIWLNQSGYKVIVRRTRVFCPITP